MDYKKIVEKYLCPGCINGCDTSCFEFKWNEKDIMCNKHSAGTFIGGNKILLGMPIGFSRLNEGYTLISIKMSWDDQPKYPFNYEKFNIPVWKHYDGFCTIVRGLSPRINQPFIDIFYGDVRDKIDCLEIAKNDMEEMD